MNDGDFRVRLLGPVDVEVDGEARAVSGLRRKAVLAVLALHPGETVSADRIIDIVWDRTPPATAANTLQAHVSHLRGILGSRATIVSRPPGYALDVPAPATDLAAAEQLIARARQANDPAASVEALRSALARWRGSALADVGDIPWLAEQAARVENLRVEAVHALVDARLALGEHGPLVAELQRLAEEHPFREHTHRQLMLALYRTGRQADALAAYQKLRRGLRDELGIEPSPELRELEAAILRQDRALIGPTPTVIVTGPPVEVPAQLPLTVSAFTGRDAEIAELDAVLAAAGAANGANIVTVSGTAGVGKTALAVHWAHRVAHAFPDGQLYVNLRGFHPSGSVVAPSVAIRAFLEAFGVPADRIPSGADAQASLYRSVLAGRRVLVVADNARDAEQVRPLLPGVPGCFVLVTSRSQLGGLVAAEGAHPLELRLPSADEARDMFTRRVGAHRVAGDPDAVDEIVASCARLPLALAITAARSALQPGLPLADLAGQLRDTEAGLDPFRGDDSATDVRAVFSWSYQTLSPEAARLFRALGVHPGPEIGVDAAASLVGVPPRAVRAHLDELTRGHLLSEHAPGRYRFHDLLSTYSAEQAARHDSPAGRHATQRRVIDHYRHTAIAAAMLLTPNRHPIPLDPPEPGVTVHRLRDVDEAMDWFVAEHTGLLAVVALDVPEFDRHVWQLAWALTTYLERRGYWRENIAVQEAGLRAATRSGDELGQAYAHRNLGNTDTRLGCYTDAGSHFVEALRLFTTQGDDIVVAHTQLSLAWVLERQNRQADALVHVESALATYRAAGHRIGLANALNTAGHCHNFLGRYDQGRTACVEALALFRELGDRPGEAATLDSLGYLFFQLGEPIRAVRAYQEAIALYRDLGDRFSEADILLNLGDGYHGHGDDAAAAGAWRSAAEILDQLDHPAAATARERLAKVTVRPVAGHRAFASGATFVPLTGYGAGNGADAA